MADIAFDTSSLVIIQTSFSFIVTPFHSPAYNLPLFLFGFYAVEKTDTNDAFRLFTGLLGLSALFDVIWLIKESYHGLVGAIIVINLLIKIPTFFACLTSLRQRGDTFGAIGRERFSGGSTTVWSMPGAFNAGQPGYQNLGENDLEENAGSPPSRPAPPGPPAPHAPLTRSGQPAAPPGPSPHSHQAQAQSIIQPKAPGGYQV